MKLRHAVGVLCGQPRNIEVKIHKNITCPRCRTMLSEDDELMATFKKLSPEVHIPIPKPTPYCGVPINDSQLEQIRLTCDCGADMKIRINKSSGNKFLGCSRFPKCKNTKPYYK